MNCKPGDLAVIVESSAGNEGKIVRCIRVSQWKALLGPNGDVSGVVWEIEPPVPGWLDGSPTAFALDQCLRPIRDPGDDAKDETLAWLTVPSQGQVERTKPDEKKVPA